MLSLGVASWFAVQVVPQHEDKVAVQLTYKDQEVLLPKVILRKTWSDRTKIVNKPLFPGYVFCRLQRSSYGTVLSTPGVHRIVSFGGKPFPVSDEEIAALQKVMSSGRNISSAFYPEPGEKVQVIKGPLEGITGVITRCKNKDRLIISVDLVMRSIAVDLEIAETQPA